VLTQGTDYDVVDTDGSGVFDSIDFSVGGDNPDPETTFEVNYETVTDASETFTYDGSQDFGLTYLPALPGDSVVTDNSGDTYVLGTDYDIVDTDGDDDRDALRWLAGGSTPDADESFTVEYEVAAGSITNVTGTVGGSEQQFVEGTDFDELDSTSDGRADQIEWLGGDTPADGTSFAVDTSVQHNVPKDYTVTEREKITPVVDEIEVTVYE
jgi:hypothetical protein